MKNFIKRVFAGFVCCSFMTATIGCGANPESQSPNNQATEQPPVQTSASEPTRIDKDVTILVPFAAGGAVDVRARIVAETLKENLGVNVTVENLTGGGGTVCAAQFLSKSKNEFDLIFTTPAPFTLSPLVTNVSYTFEDVTPVAAVDAEVYGLYICPEKSGLETFDDVIEYGKEKELIFGSGGPSTNLHLLQSELYRRLGMTSNALPHKGAKEGLTNIMGGHSVITMAGLEVARDYVKEGMVVPVLTFTEEAYTGYDGFTVPPVTAYTDADLASMGRMTFFMREKTDKATLDAMSDALNQAIADPDCAEKLHELKGLDCSGESIEEMKEFLKEENELFAKLLQQ